MRSVLFVSMGIFMLEMSKKHGIFFIGWVKILMNLILVVLILTTHSLASLIMPLLCVKLAIVLTITVHLVPIIFLKRVLPNLAV